MLIFNVNLTGAAMSDISDKLGKVVNEALYPALRKVFGGGVTDGFITAVIVSAFMLIFAAVLRIFVIPKFKAEGTPSKMQMFLEGVVTYFDNNSKNILHKKPNFLGLYMFTTAAFIALTTLTEFFGMRPTFSTLNGCVAFGLSTFILIQIEGLINRGLGRRSKRLLNPINILTDLSVPLSLSLRLFGSVTSGFIIMEILYSIPYTSVIVPALGAIVTTLFHASIQSYLFSTLTGVFVGEAVEAA